MPVLIEGLFVLNFHIFFRAFFFISRFSFLFPNIWTLSVPDVLPSVKFQKFGGRLFAQNQIYIMNPPVISAENEVAPTGALSTLFGRIFWRTTDRLQRGSAAKNKRGGTLLLCFENYLLIAENRTKRKTAQCSVPWQRHRQPNATKPTTL